jgi:hypothetical protein
VNIAEITNSSQLREFMSAPTVGVIDCVGKVRGEILILGGSGKMGPELTEMIVRQVSSAQYPLLPLSATPGREQRSCSRRWG